MSRVLIVGPRLDVRRALEIRLGLESDLVVVGSLDTLDERAPSIRDLNPDVLLVDVDSCDDGEVSRARAQIPGVPIVLLVHEVDGETRRRAVEWGGVHLVSKSIPADWLVEVLRDPRQGFV